MSSQKNENHVVKLNQDIPELEAVEPLSGTQNNQNNTSSNENLSNFFLEDIPSQMNSRAHTKRLIGFLNKILKSEDEAISKIMSHVKEFTQDKDFKEFNDFKNKMFKQSKQNNAFLSSGVMYASAKKDLLSPAKSSLRSEILNTNSRSDLQVELFKFKDFKNLIILSFSIFYTTI